MGRGIHLASLGGVCLMAAIASYQIAFPPQQGQTVLDYHPPWEQRPTNYNRYRMVRGVAGKQQQLVEVKSGEEADYTPSWKYRRTYHNRYRISASRQQRYAMGEGSFDKHTKYGPGVLAGNAVGRAIFDKMKKSIGMQRAAKSPWHALQHPKLLAGQGPEPGAGPLQPDAPVSNRKDGIKAKGVLWTDISETNSSIFDAPRLDGGGPTPQPDEEDIGEKEPDTIYVYDGRETQARSSDLVTFILAAGFALPNIRYIQSSSDADIRSATWDDDCRTIIFPPLHDIPDFAPNAVKDLRHFVSKGNGKAGMILFMGSSVQVHLMNEVFGLELQQDYKEGPYYKNERNVKGTLLQHLPSRVNEMGQTENLGLLKIHIADWAGPLESLLVDPQCKKATMPPGTKSYYDSFGDSVASCMRWDLGRVCYLAQDFKPLEELRDLQIGAMSEEPRVSRAASYHLEILSRKTDTWLAIFHAMLESEDI